MLLKNCDFGVYLPEAKAFVIDSGTSDSSKKYPKVEPPKFRLDALALVYDITTKPQEAKIDR